MTTPRVERSDLRPIDELMPDFDQTIVERDMIDGTPETVYTAIRQMDFLSIRTPLVTAAMGIREVPARLGRLVTRRSEPPPPASMRLGDLFDDPTSGGLGDWSGLVEDPPHALVFGAVGKVWRPRIEWRALPAADFAGFAEPGYAKIAASFDVRAAGEHRCAVTYEARTQTTDELSRRRFGRYWRLVRPFVGAILRAALATAAAEAAASDRSPTDDLVSA